VLLAPTMTVRQWVASSGLDPAHQQSGTSLHKPSRISRAGNRHLRRALYMPALSAARNDPHLRAFYLALRSRHKTGLQALMAVARKLLHAIYGIFKSGTPYDGKLLFPNIQTAVESIAGETEAGSAGKQPCRGITRWAHPEMNQRAGRERDCSPEIIRWIDPDALKSKLARRKLLTSNRESTDSGVPCESAYSR